MNKQETIRYKMVVCMVFQFQHFNKHHLFIHGEIFMDHLIPTYGHL